MKTMTLGRRVAKVLATLSLLATAASGSITRNLDVDEVQVSPTEKDMEYAVYDARHNETFSVMYATAGTNAGDLTTNGGDVQSYGHKSGKSKGKGGSSPSTNNSSKSRGKGVVHTKAPVMSKTRAPTDGKGSKKVTRKPTSGGGSFKTKHPTRSSVKMRYPSAGKGSAKTRNPTSGKGSVKTKNPTAGKGSVKTKNPTTGKGSEKTRHPTAGKGDTPKSDGKGSSKSKSKGKKNSKDIVMKPDSEDMPYESHKRSHSKSKSDKSKTKSDKAPKPSSHGGSSKSKKKKMKTKRSKSKLKTKMTARSKPKPTHKPTLSPTPKPTAGVTAAPSVSAAPSTSQQPTSGPTITPNPTITAMPTFLETTLGPSAEPSPTPPPVTPAPTLPTFPTVPTIPTVPTAPSGPTIAPTPPPTPSAPIEPTRVNVVLSPYALGFTVSDNRIPFRSEFLEVTELTASYLNQYFEMVFMRTQMTSFIDSVTEFTGSSFDFGQPIQVELSTTLVFAQSSSVIPDISILDEALSDAFNGDAVAGFIGMVQNLPPSNVFSTTLSVDHSLLPDDAMAASSRRQSSNAGTTGAIVGAAGFAFLVAGLAIYSRRRRNRSVCEPNVEEKREKSSPGGATVAGETYTGSWSVDQSETQPFRQREMEYEPSDDEYDEDDDDDSSDGGAIPFNNDDSDIVGLACNLDQTMMHSIPGS